MRILLERIIAKRRPPYSVLPAFYTQAGWVRVRLTELLPLDLGFKHRLLEANDGYTRVAQLREDMAHIHLV